MRETLKVVVLYPILNGLFAAAGCHWIGRHENLCFLALFLAISMLVWFPRSLVPYMRKRRS